MKKLAIAFQNINYPNVRIYAWVKYFLTNNLSLFFIDYYFNESEIGTGSSQLSPKTT